MYLRELDYKGATALLTAYAGKYFYQMVGASTALEAIWAHLSSRETRRRGYAYYSLDIQLEKDVVYKKFLNRLSGTCTWELVMVHPAVSKDWVGDEFLLISRDNRMPAAFFNRLRLCLRLPLRPEWALDLWDLGQKNYPVEQRSSYGGTYTTQITPIERLHGEGICGWTVSTTEHEAIWLGIIRQILAKEKTDGPA